MKTRSEELQEMSKEEFLKIPEIKTKTEEKIIHVTRHRCWNCDDVIHEGHFHFALSDGTFYCKSCNSENRVMCSAKIIACPIRGRKKLR